MDIIATIAREKRVERMAENICRSHRPEVRDLCQTIYLALLGKDPAVIEAAWRDGWLNFLIARMLCNQWHSVSSPFRLTYRGYSIKAQPLEDEDA